ncbi:hypothetical protein PsorP6_011185 [Peronosclerospora sorghi]|uniref:Uncharacterized protein n=1 Tax=Peronosclerospora sorghi TaxID=230839 RepID=A0ACC0VV47_9STRA|nr:hypothetical protein PsorP6_011185 [Peronosclerospora sorghi]
MTWTSIDCGSAEQAAADFKVIGLSAFEHQGVGFFPDASSERRGDHLGRSARLLAMPRQG